VAGGVPAVAGDRIGKQKKAQDRALRSEPAPRSGGSVGCGPSNGATLSLLTISRHFVSDNSTMKPKKISLCAIFVLLVVACFQSHADAAGTTARAGLAQAQEAAGKWKADATLVQKITFSGSADGTAGKWTYVFHSPKAKQGHQVVVSNGKIASELDVSASFTDSLDSDFIDSSQAMAEAAKTGLVINGDAMMMLMVMQTNTKNEGGYWNVLGDMTAEMSLLISARTGKFFKEHKFQ
jgi:hypothetical protein